ncbi:hypothetical protein D1B32_13305 [Oceanobacillus profundus]|uniref:Uncharacterized protein n=1 Tax=Oceanobacillus profundus TaxID=372463 RepID=A0A417YG73_9BACI|nr:hypothetical protein CHI07_00265 [Paenibacillus sp. 7884-2]RHW31693.1 hypothetical protein D1B32_13305 [Oceanobacillus profundus]
MYYNSIKAVLQRKLIFSVTQLFALLENRNAYLIINTTTFSNFLFVRWSSEGHKLSIPTYIYYKAASKQSEE